MASSNNANKQQQQAGADSGGSKPAAARPHWRHRDPTAAAVYVVHPTRFRDVVQQLTGAPPAASPPATAAERSLHQGGGNGTGTGTAACSNAAARHQQQGGGEGSSSSSSSSRQRTLGEMYQECMAWANEDDC